MTRQLLQLQRPLRIVVVFDMLYIASISWSFIISQDGHEYCQWETFNATCAHDQLIVMQTARYGRMRFGRCMREDHGSVGCSADVLPYLDRRCSGRHSCQLPIPDATLHAIHPCPKELMPYLEATYSCVRAVNGNRHACALFGGQPMKASTGFLTSSIQSPQMPVGSQSCPWMVRALPGQRVNLTLFSFYIPDRDQTSPDGGSSGGGSGSSAAAYQVLSRCLPQRLVVQERNRSLEIAVCSEKRRERHLYTSDSNEVNIYIHSNLKSPPPPPAVSIYDGQSSVPFLIKYQVIGCPDIVDQSNALVQRHGDTAVIKCNFSGETFYVTCIDTDWKGELSTCIKVAPMGSGPTTDRTPTYTQGILIVIGIGVALGVSLGIIVLVAVLVFLRRAKQHQLRCAAARNRLLLESDDKYAAAVAAQDLQYTQQLDDMSADMLQQQQLQQLQQFQLQEKLDRRNSLSISQPLCPYHQHFIETPPTTTMMTSSSEMTSHDFNRTTENLEYDTAPEILYSSPKFGQLYNYRRHPACDANITSSSLSHAQQHQQPQYQQELEQQLLMRGLSQHRVPPSHRPTNASSFLTFKPPPPPNSINHPTPSSVTDFTNMETTADNPLTTAGVTRRDRADDCGGVSTLDNGASLDLIRHAKNHVTVPNHVTDSHRVNSVDQIFDADGNDVDDDSGDGRLLFEESTISGDTASEALVGARQRSAQFS